MNNLSNHNPLFFHLLMKFREPKNSKDFDQNQWAIILGKDFDDVLQIFIHENLITEASTPDYLVKYFSAEELKNMARERKVKLSGKKSDIASTLFDTDPIGMDDQKLYFLPLFRINDIGKDIDNKYFSSLFTNTNNNILESLHRQIIEAKDRLISYCRQQQKTSPSYEDAISNSFEIPYVHIYEPDIDLINNIFSRTPKTLDDVIITELQLFRLETIFRLVFGPRKYESIFPRDYETRHRLGNWGIISALETHAKFIHGLEEAKKGNFRFIEFFSSSGQDACPYCKNIAEKLYEIEDVPELPFSGCTHPDGCRCWFVLHFSNESFSMK